MVLESMSVTRGLAELKTLDARIRKAIHENTYVSMTTGKKPLAGYHTNEEFEKEVESKFQSANDLIARRNKIKSAIVKSNAETVVVISDEKMTVAEAIERKSSIAYDQELLRKLKSDYSNVIRLFEREEESVKQRLDKQLETTYGRDAKLTPDQYDNVAKPFLEQNQPNMIDPLKIKEKIDYLEKRIDDFLTNVDFSLSESNAITKIEI